MAEYVITYRAPDESVVVEDLDGVSWYKAPAPRRWHRCWPQTRGYTGYVNYVERCACGAIRMRDNGPWISRNERRRKRESA